MASLTPLIIVLFWESMTEQKDHTRFVDYFTFIADKIEIDSRISGLASHRTDKGTNRERLVEIFLSKHLPRRLKPFLGGTVFGVSGAESKQIDVLVSSDLAVNFEEEDKMFIAVENVAAAITVKSYLDKDAIYDSLANLASVPQIEQRVLSFKFLQPNPFSEFIAAHPSLFVFAYDGVSMEVCTEHMKKFIEEHPDIPNNRYPLAVIVNKRYMIKYERKASVTKLGVAVDPNTFLSVPLVPSTQGYPLVTIISAISAYTDWLPFMTINNELYFRLAYGLPTE